ncbi:MAG: PAS domain S-box protein, partial [Gammaproteobacteria bacterium]|nr:PAS domain S-box protein [Gammaproteobacteria bacterium]
ERLVNTPSIENHLKHLFMLSHDMLCAADRDGYFCILNPAASKILGYSLQELFSQPLTDFIHPDDLEKTQAEVAKFGEGYKTVGFENRYRCKAGHYIWLEWSAQADPETGLTYATARDITSRKCMQEMLTTTLNKNAEQLNLTAQELVNEVRERQKTYRALINSERRFDSLTAIVPAGVFSTNANGEIIYVNQRWRDITGLDADIILKTHWINALHLEDQADVTTCWGKSLATKTEFKIEFHYSRDGETVFVIAEACPQFNTNDEFTGFIGTITDITQLRKIEKKNTQIRSELAEYDNFSIAGELANGIAHEINQPLTAIMQYVGGCRQRLINIETPTGTMEALECIGQLAKKSAAIIYRLRDFLVTGKLIKKPCHIKKIIADIMPIITFNLKKHKVKLELSPNNELAKIYADPIQIQQVFLNLIRNSMDALVENKIAKPKITIRAKPDNTKKYLNISITDNGGGIPPHMTNKIFEHFVSSKANGMGIGLSISKSIIEAHDGKIYATSKHNITEFHVSLPLANTTAEVENHIAIHEHTA